MVAFESRRECKISTCDAKGSEPMSADSEPTTITITFPQDPLSSGWNVTNLLRAVNGISQQVTGPPPPVAPSPNGSVCQRRVVYSQSTTGQLISTVEILVCDGPCDSPDSVCEWVPVVPQLAIM
jgi:hypothetical protein